MIDDWVSISVLSWSLYVWITNLNFSYAFDVLECLISSTNLKLKIRTSRETFSMMINSNTRLSSKSFTSFRLEFSKIEMKTSSNWFENSSFWRKTMISAKFWYFSDRRLARVSLVIANELVIASELMIAGDLVISKDSADRLSWWSDDWIFSEIDWTSSVDSTSLIDLIKNDLITELRKSVDSDDKTILQVSSSISSNLNDSIHFLSSRHIRTSELRSRSWIDVIIESFRVFNASIIWRSTRNFLISVMTFSIVIARWIIDEIERFIACIRKYVPKISKMSINSSESIVSLIALTIIWSIISLLIVSFVDSVIKSSLIIWYARRSSTWYLFTKSIDQWASTSTALMIIVIEMTNWRNFLLAKFLSASVNMWSKRLR
jgi:hypothetical protein